jgi:hypothetical protein
MPSLTAGATLNIEMDEDAKVPWAETVDKPRYRQFTIWGTLGTLVEGQKDLYELVLCSTHRYLRTREFSLLGITCEFGHGTHSDID